MALLSAPEKNRSEIRVLINSGRGNFAEKANVNLEESDLDIVFIAAGDLDGDRADDLVLIGRSGKGSVAKLLFNNKKGYFYEKEGAFLPPVHKGMERVDLVDLDRDGDIDLFFSGTNVTGPDGKPDERQAQIMINNGKGRFSDASGDLLPPLAPGIVYASFADYDGDAVADVFLVYRSGQNALLVNNGLGKFSDESAQALPKIPGRNLHADWADFDGDKDNDILVVTAGIDDAFRDYPSEYCYVLENDGRGRFTKRPLKVLPNVPSRRVYLLDADGNKTVDAIILTQRGPHFLKGVGKWGFSLETRKGLPGFFPVSEMAFGDFDGDGFLDIFVIDAKTGKGRLWIDSFN
ncbi:MAG: VCBS repeat-containing protein [Nitrospinae bacterium]|nr:VCBS repeat-containing protein [Nitrospinota bacterium]